MRIGTTHGPTRTERRGSTRREGGDSFSDLLRADDAPAARPAATAGNVTAMSSLIAVQEVDDREARRRQLINHGDRLLDLLTDLRHGLIMGGLSKATIETITATLRSKKEHVDDPALLSLIRDVELRAEVELAKLERIVTSNMG